MNKITNYFRESYRELLEKVTWPTWSELQQSTVIVLVATLLITVLVWLMDVIASSVLHSIYAIHFFADKRVLYCCQNPFYDGTVNQQEVKTQPEAKPAPETKWYVLRVVSGKERKVKEYLDKEISRGGWREMVKQVFLPMEKVYKVQNGKKVMRERNYYPGYVMVEVTEGKLGDDLTGGDQEYTQCYSFPGKGKSDCAAESRS